MKVTVKRIPKLLKSDRGQRYLREELDTAKHVMGERVVARVRVNIGRAKPYPPVDTGRLLGGIHADVERTRVTVAPSAETMRYAVVMEAGREPGRWPPSDVILKWVKRKFRAKPKSWFLERVGGSEKQSKKKLVATFAFLVQRAIGTRGITGRWFFRKTQKQTPKIVRAAIVMAIKRALERTKAG